MMRLSVVALLVFLLAASLMVVDIPAIAGDGAEKISTVEEGFSDVMKLKGTPAEGEINAIAKLLILGSGIMSIDFGSASGEFCLLESKTRDYMIHFSRSPENTKEDIIYFIDPDTFVSMGLRVEELPAHPGELGAMVPLKWYYYDGKGIEPHHGKRLGKEFLVMAIDVK